MRAMSPVERPGEKKSDKKSDDTKKDAPKQASQEGKPAASALDELWDDAPLSKKPKAMADIEKKAPKPPKEMRRSFTDPLEEQESARQKTFYFLMTVAETLMISALVLVGVWMAYQHFFDFDIFSEPYWRRLQTYFDQGNMIPWPFVGGLSGWILVTILAFAKLYKINMDLDKELCHKMAKIFFLPVWGCWSGVSSLTRGAYRLTHHTTRKTGKVIGGLQTALVDITRKPSEMASQRKARKAETARQREHDHANEHEDIIIARARRPHEHEHE